MMSDVRRVRITSRPRPLKTVLYVPVSPARTGVDSRRQHHPPPEIPEVVREDAQLQPDLVGPEAVARQTHPVRCLLALIHCSAVSRLL